MRPDVEALLVNRVGSTRQYFLVPIDECYRLVGLIRLHWRGLSGGALVWGEIAEFFDELRGKEIMPGLTFGVEAAEAIPFAAAPTIAFRLRVDERAAIQSVALRARSRSKHTAPLYVRRTPRSARSVRRAGSLEPDIAAVALDPRLDYRSGVFGFHRR